ARRCPRRGRRRAPHERRRRRRWVGRGLPRAGAARPGGRPAVTGSSLRAKVVLPLIAVGVAVGAGGAWYTQRTFATLVAQQVRHRAELLMNAVTYAVEITADPAELVRTVNSLGGERDVLFIAVVADRPARVVASTRNAWINLPAGWCCGRSRSCAPRWTAGPPATRPPTPRRSARTRSAPWPRRSTRCSTRSPRARRVSGPCSTTWPTES